jgi:hypothetical protein
LLAGEELDELGDTTKRIDLSDNTEVTKLADGKKVLELGLSEHEILLVQAPNACP